MSDKRPQTIQIFLPQGEPRGIRIASIPTRNIQAVLVPHIKLSEALQRDELKSSGVYFLFGETEEVAKPMAYIGEAEDCYKGILEDSAYYSFGNTAIAIVSKTVNFSKDHAKYLRMDCIKTAMEVNRFHLFNAVVEGLPFVTQSMQADMMDIFDTVRTLTSALGCLLFEARPQPPDEDIFFLTGPDCEARGQLVEDGFTVFAGSKGLQKFLPSANEWCIAVRQDLLASGVVMESSNQIIFREDYTFPSPTGAAAILLRGSMIGQINWKNKAGETLREATVTPSPNPEPVFMRESIRP